MEVAVVVLWAVVAGGHSGGREGEERERAVRRERREGDDGEEEGGGPWWLGAPRAAVDGGFGAEEGEEVGGGRKTVEGVKENGGFAPIYKSSNDFRLSETAMSVEYECVSLKRNLFA